MSDKRLPVSSSKPPTPAETKPVLYLFFVIEVWNIATVSQIALDGTGSVDIFDTLRKEYLRKQGPVRNIFRFWKSSHCELAKVRRREHLVICVVSSADLSGSLKGSTRIDVYAGYRTRPLRSTSKTNIRLSRRIRYTSSCDTPPL
jgi:hypothetical protein